jgi:hypothetical protein
MGKFQLNKKGEDPIKIYEDVFKISQGTVESHLDKLGKQQKPISRESDDTSRFEADIENDQLIQKLPTDKRSFNVEADNFPQKDFGSVNQWEDDLDELRGLGGKLPDTNALWNSVEAIASEGHELDDQSSDFQYHKGDSSDLLRTDQRTRNPDGSISYNDMAYTGSYKQGQVGRADYKMGFEDYGNMNIVQNPNSDNDGYPMDQEGFARANWDDASIEDRKNWLFKAGYDSERGDEYEPYFSLDSHIRAQLAKDLQIGGIYAMGTGSL